MKKVSITIVLLFLVQLLHAAVSIEVVKTTYDANFNPTYTLKVKNTDAKTVTNIVVTFALKDSYTSIHDVLGYKYVERNLKVTVYPNSTALVSTTISIPDNYTLWSTSLEKVRFSYGSIKSR